MTTVNYNESINVEREKANLLCLIKLTLNTLIEQSLSASSSPVLDDRNSDVTNFIVTLEHALSFRMRGTWLSDKRYFWDFIRPGCIGSCRQSIVERVEEISTSGTAKEKGRIWIKFALMEKKLSELLKLVISDCHLVQKFYHDDSIIMSSQAFILCDQLAGLNAIDFSFCFKRDAPIIAPILLNDTEIDVIDLTPFLCFKPKQFKQSPKIQNSNESNKGLLSNTAASDEVDSPECKMVTLDKYKLEVEQRKYFEELLQHRDRELQQLKVRYDTIKGERESEILQLENIILELQLELREVRDEAETKRKKSQQLNSTTPPRSPSYIYNRKSNSLSSTPNRDLTENNNMQMNWNEISPKNTDNQTLNIPMKNMNPKQFDDNIFPSSSESNHSTTINNIDHEDRNKTSCELPSSLNDNNDPNINGIQSISNTKIPAHSLSSSLDENRPVQIEQTTILDENKSVTNESS